MQEMITHNQRTCDLCKRQKDIVYDGPFFGMSWGYVCVDCVESKRGGKIPAISTKIIYKPKPEAQDKEVYGLEVSTDVDILVGDRRIKCPNCQHIFNVEIDAISIQRCKSCGVNIILPLAFLG